VRREWACPACEAPLEWDIDAVEDIRCWNCNRPLYVHYEETWDGDWDGYYVEPAVAED